MEKNLEQCFLIFLSSQLTFTGVVFGGTAMRHCGKATLTKIEIRNKQNTSKTCNLGYVYGRLHLINGKS